MKTYYGVGFIGSGSYGGRKGDRKEYDIWRSMLSRCYDKKNRKYRIYGARGCVVCKEWHNFQSFAKWYNLNYKDGYCVDKDIKIKGNKIYSSETCVLIPKTVNDFLTSNRSDNKSGVKGLSWSKQRNKWVVTNSDFDTKKYKSHGRFSSKINALEKLVELKNKNFKKVKNFLVNEHMFDRDEVEKYQSISDVKIADFCDIAKFDIYVHGLGYVGCPIAIAFDKAGYNVVGYDKNEEKIKKYKLGVDQTKEVGDSAISDSNVLFVKDLCDVKNSVNKKFHIISVPTPIDENMYPDISYVRDATMGVSKILNKGDYVVYESTVCPGTTRDCINIIESETGMVCGVDFKAGFSPERVSPATKIKLNEIVKVVSGVDEESLDTIAEVYNSIIDAGVHKAESIEIAEACKIMENIQRDVNIALMNEFSNIFNHMDIDTNSVIRASKTKWNFNEYYPGLVGGHCIGIDPYYLINHANKKGVKIPIIESARQTNENLVNKIFLEIAKMSGVRDKNIAILGLTFKENCNDMRNSKTKELFDILKESKANVFISDYVADCEDVKKIYGQNVIDISELSDMDCVVIAVKHDDYMSLTKSDFDRMCRSKNIIDIKGIYEKYDTYKYFSL